MNQAIIRHEREIVSAICKVCQRIPHPTVETLTFLEECKKHQNDDENMFCRFSKYRHAIMSDIYSVILTSDNKVREAELILHTHLFKQQKIVNESRELELKSLALASKGKHPLYDFDMIHKGFYEICNMSQTLFDVEYAAMHQACLFRNDFSISVKIADWELYLECKSIVDREFWRIFDSDSNWQNKVLSLLDVSTSNGDKAKKLSFT